jgi:hypothetical protein
VIPDRDPRGGRQAPLSINEILPTRSRGRPSICRLSGWSAIALLAAASLACGGGSAPSPPAAPGVQSPASPTPTPTTSPSPTPSGPPTVTITASGVDPLELTVEVGARVTFVNRDVLPHDLFGGPNPSIRECPEIDVVGFLVPGQSRQTPPFTAPQTCRYHDHGQLGNPRFEGRIIVR